MKIHSVFHISLLKLALLEILEGPTSILNDGMKEEEYEIKRIINVIKK
jgi:hypothetical protein